MVLPSNLHIELPFSSLKKKKRKKKKPSCNFIFCQRTFLSETAVFVWVFGGEGGRGITSYSCGISFPFFLCFVHLFSPMPWVLKAINFRLYIIPRKLCRSPIVTRNIVCTLWHYVSDMRVTDSSSVTVWCAFPSAKVYDCMHALLGQDPLTFLSDLKLHFCSPKPKPPSLCSHQIPNFFIFSVLSVTLDK